MRLKLNIFRYCYLEPISKTSYSFTDVLNTFPFMPLASAFLHYVSARHRQSMSNWSHTGTVFPSQQNILHVSTFKHEVSKCVASTLDEHLSSKVIAIISKCGELKTIYDKKMKALTSDLEVITINHRNTLLEDKITSQSFEQMSKQLSISNAEITKCIFIIYLQWWDI